MKVCMKLLTLLLVHPNICGVNGFISSRSSLAKITSVTDRFSHHGALYSSFAESRNENGANSQQGGPSFPMTGSSPEGSPPAWKITSPPQKEPTTILKGKEGVWESAPKVTVQGGSLRTCSFNESVDRVQVLMKTDGRPLNANVELWQGPDNSPQRINVYIEDGSHRQFRAVIETPRGSNAVCIRNTAQMEFPLTACVDVDVEDGAGVAASNPTAKLSATSKSKIVQGGAVSTTPFAPNVSSVQVMLKTDGRPLNARIELLQGPNNNKQVMELYIEDGMDRPFYAIIETPGSGNVVRIVNTSTVEFPMSATVVPYEEVVGSEKSSGDTGMVWSD